MIAYFVNNYNEFAQLCENTGLKWLDFNVTLKYSDHRNAVGIARHIEKNIIVYVQNYLEFVNKED